MPFRITGREALDVVAKSPDFAEKTPADLRLAAHHFEEDAIRKDRLAEGRRASGRQQGTRAAARRKAAEREADQLRLHAMVVREAADEIDKRKSPTVAEAMRNPVVRYLRRLGGKTNPMAHQGRD